PPWAEVSEDAPGLPEPADDLADLDVDPTDWDVQRCDTAERQATGPNGQEATLVDGVISLRRRTS
ncbi:MAG: hypothetical protein KA755_12045, partial [Candidatus Microthrix sp.]|nr:hypothetical protein [Candidatus Microthrix sp.]